ncbi:glycosyltransferase family 4 protein [Labrys wisconsinensis]|uniref:Glycosyltransferase involved in cell wall biosynthesis n=1 Tax=Labrys wisconsinensis TaxID=425677 RepID=A0ABU0IYF9_9HYPH|nr:glycosyltransferase family 4 protein [Labrys wisconsinensis]MDQ0467050.1 glycosyltransferase involved in cell wall biosynthesis [Labrys wisconsinensis]
MTQAPPGQPRIAVVVKGYPRLSETFIAQELLGLEQAGLALEIWSLRRPTDGAVHEMHLRIAAPVHYLPEYLYQAPWRVLKGAWAALRRPRLRRVLAVFWKDVLRDPTPNRGRRLGQALVLAHELSDAVRHVHVHYLHTPASVARYAALLTGRTFSFSAHAKDIWTTTDWEKREKIADSAWGVTCTCVGCETLRRLSPDLEPEKVSLVYHGLDLSRFPEPPQRRADADGSGAERAVAIVAVGRAVAKKGFGDLLEALARLPADLAWRFTHIGSGELLPSLKEQARRLGLADRITWRGGLPQQAVIEALQAADLFALPCREGEAGDRDGLPNVIMEAATQALPILSTRFAGVPEFVREGRDGVLVPPGDVAALAAALEALIRDPARRAALGVSALERLQSGFSFGAGIATLVAKFDESLAAAAP